jgi:phosphoglycolate phosphatase/AHBA synthesis associated protein
MLPRAVLFDMDGVLVRSEEVWFRVVEQAGVQFRGRAITREEFFPTFGQGTAADVPFFGLRCTTAELDAFYVREFVQHLAHVWVNPEAAPLLEALRARGVKLALVTNTVEPLASAVIDHAKLGAWLPVRATADQVAHAKPAPDLVQLACLGLGVTPAEAWLVGDSKYDRGSAHAAGARFVGLRIDGDVRLEHLREFPLTDE